MGDTTTPNLGLIKPAVGASRSTWGNKWNANADDLDAAVLAKTGGTMTGDLKWISTGSTTARSAQDRTGERFNVKDFGAIGDGVADDSTAIQAAMDAAATLGGGQVVFPVGIYKISTTLAIGNGTASVVSTKAGVTLIGEGRPSTMGFFTGYTIPPPVQLVWAGPSGASSMISVLGPIQGWGLQGLALNGENIAGTGITVVSAMFGDCRDVMITGCMANGIVSTTVPLFGGVGGTNSLQNAWRRISIACPIAANVRGILLTGALTPVNSDTAMNLFEDLFIALPPSGAAVAIYLQSCDTNTFVRTHIANGSAAATGILFDYASVPGQFFPSANSFFGIEANGAVLGARQFINSGAPSINARPNYIRGLDQANGSTNPAIANLLPDLPVAIGPNVFLQSQSGSIAGTVLYQPFAAGIYRVSLYLALQSSGTAGATVSAGVSWNDGAGRAVNTAAIDFGSGADNPQTLALTVFNVANLGINYATTVSGAPGGGTYMLAIVIERLS